MWERKYPLPTGMQAFEDWSDRIIKKVKFQVNSDSLKFVLADQITHLDPTESHKEDSFFLRVIHKYAANQIAVAKRAEIKAKQQAKAAQTEIDKVNQIKEEALAKEIAKPSPTHSVMQ